MPTPLDDFETELAEIDAELLVLEDSYKMIETLALADGTIDDSEARALADLKSTIEAAKAERRKLIADQADADQAAEAEAARNATEAAREDTWSPAQKAAADAGDEEGRPNASMDEVPGALPDELKPLLDEYEKLSDDVLPHISILEPVASAKATYLLGRITETINAEDVEATERLLAELRAVAVELGPPPLDIDPATLEAIESFDASLMEERLQSGGLNDWTGDDVAEGIALLQEALLTATPGTTLHRVLSDNLGALTEEQTTRWDNEDTALNEQLRRDDLARYSDETLENMRDVIRKLGDPSDSLQSANELLIVTVLAERANADAADEALAMAAGIKVADATTSTIEPALDALRVALALPHLPEDKRAALEEEVKRLGSAVLARQDAAERYAQETRLPGIKPDDVEFQEMLDWVPGFAQADMMRDFQEAQLGLVSGVMQGYNLEAPVDGFKHAWLDDVDWGSFYISYTKGVFVGMWNGVVDLGKTVVMLGEFAAEHLGPEYLIPGYPLFKLQQLGYEEAKAYLEDREGYVKKRSEDIEKVQRIIKAIDDLENDFDANAFSTGSQIGKVIGKVLAVYEDEFQKLKTDAERGQRIGEVAGAIALEIVTDVLLTLCTAGVGAAAKATQAVLKLNAAAKAVTKGAKWAPVLYKAIRNMPMIKKFRRTIGKAADAAGEVIEKAGDNLADLRKLVDDLKSKPKRDPIPDGSNPKTGASATGDTPKPPPGTDPPKQPPKPDGPPTDTGGSGGTGKPPGGGGNPPDGPPPPGDKPPGGPTPPKRTPDEIVKALDDAPPDGKGFDEIVKAMDEAPGDANVARAIGKKLDEIEAVLSKTSDTSDIKAALPKSKKNQADKLSNNVTKGLKVLRKQIDKGNPDAAKSAWGALRGAVREIEVPRNILKDGGKLEELGKKMGAKFNNAEFDVIYEKGGKRFVGEVKTGREVKAQKGSKKFQKFLDGFLEEARIAKDELDATYQVFADAGEMSDDMLKALTDAKIEVVFSKGGFG